MKKLLKKIGFSMILLLGVAAVSFGQKAITGKITGGDTNEALIGANVVIKGTTNGAITDIDGMYSIMANENDVLVVSYLGYTTQEMVVGASNVMNLSLAEGALIQEVVVTGYTVDTRRSTPGSVSTIESAALKVQPSGNVEQQLQGRVPGVTVVSNGQPGTVSQVRVRGFGALGGNEPLYIVDGVPVGSTDFLAPDDIESTTVLKDATSASIYGARAAGGVIVYTTKQGKKGNSPLKVSYNGMIGATTPGEGNGVLNPQQQAEWTRNAIRNGALANGTEAGDIEYSHPQYGTGTGDSWTPSLPDFLLVGGNAAVNGNVDLNAEEANYNIDPNAGPIYQVVRANQAGTDWYDEITRTGILHRHNLGFSGGMDGGRIYVGLGVQDQEGILLHQKFSRYHARVNSEFDILPGLSVGQNLQMTHRSTRVLLGDAGGAGSSDDENVFLAASRMSPIIPVFDEFGGYAGTAAPGFNNPANPVAELDGRQNDRGFENAIFGNVYLKYSPIDNLTLKSSFGGRHGASSSVNFSRRTYENQENNSSFGYSRFEGNGTAWTWTNTANYSINVGGNSDLDILVGQEALNTGTFRGISASGINPFAQTPDFVTLSTVGSRVVNEFTTSGVTFSSLFGRVKYDFNDKYIVSAVVRRDGSSRFGAENRFGVFPAFSLAWRVSEESFMQGSNLFDDLKIRGGYGIMGNSNNVDPNNQFSLFGTSIGASSYDIGGTNSSAVDGFFRTRIGNPAARWERAVTANVGIDALLLDGALDLGVEVWSKRTEDLLFQAPVSVMTGGFASAPSVNVGEMLNTGIDLFVSYRGGSSDKFRYEVAVTGGFLNNEIVALADGIESLPNRSASYRGITPVLNQVGEPISAFFGYEVVGLFENDAAVAAAPTQEGAAPGRFQFADLDGDGEITIDDRTTLGSPVPDFTGGLNIDLDFGNIGLDIYSYASIGNEIFNASKIFTDFYPLFPGAAISDRVVDSWTPDNLDATIPIFESNSNFSTNTQSNSFYVEDGSYFRLQNITLSYNVPSSTASTRGLESARLFAGVNNVFTITGYSGADPSVGGAADTNFGIDLGNFPITRSWTAGVNIAF